MITQRTKYALKALLALADARAEDDPALRIEDVAERGGGYVMVKEPRTISLGEVLRLIDGPPAPLPCLSRRAYRRCEDCTDEATCRVRAVFGGFYATSIVMIESLTIADVLHDAAPLERFALPEVAAGE